MVVLHPNLKQCVSIKDVDENSLRTEGSGVKD